MDGETAITTRFLPRVAITSHALQRMRLQRVVKTTHTITSLALLQRMRCNV